jgi:hypothetical protein
MKGDNADDLRQFNTALCAAMSLKSAYAYFIGAVYSYVIERLQAAGLDVFEERRTQ